MRIYLVLFCSLFLYLALHAPAVGTKPPPCYPVTGIFSGQFRLHSRLGAWFPFRRARRSRKDKDRDGELETAKAELRDLFRSVPGLVSKVYEDEDRSSDSPFFCAIMVSGKGDCLFESLAACLLFAETKRLQGFSAPLLRSRGLELREVAVDRLQGAMGGDDVTETEEETGDTDGHAKVGKEPEEDAPRTGHTSSVSETERKEKFLSRPPLCFNGQQIDEASLLRAAAEGYDLPSPSHYLMLMRQPGTWGGGPEILSVASSIDGQILLYEQTGAAKVKLRARFGVPGSGPCLRLLYTQASFPLWTQKEKREVPAWSRTGRPVRVILRCFRLLPFRWRSKKSRGPAKRNSSSLPSGSRGRRQGSAEGQGGQEGEESLTHFVPMFVLPLKRGRQKENERLRKG